MNSLTLHRRRGPLRRAIYSLNAATPDDVIQAVPPANLAGKHFALFLAWDARAVPGETIFTFAQKLIRAGLSYIVAWGPDCERVHDIFDDADIAENPESNEQRAVIMSTWHERESLEQALWFAVYCACPDAAYESTTISTIAAAIGNQRWARAVQTNLDDLSKLNASAGSGR